MTKFKIYRINSVGRVTVTIVEAYDWSLLLANYQYNGDPIFKIEVVGGDDPVSLQPRHRGMNNE